MTENSRERNLEVGLFALAFALAFALRLLRLGEMPLTDDEARWALQALDLAKGLRPVMGPQPAYIVLTSLVFFIIQASNFAARFVPALFGAALSIAPFYFRDRLGNKPAIVLAFLLALDPGFLALSRLAGSPVLSVAALLFAWGAWRKENLRAAGIWIGFALLCGPSLWPGLLGLAIAFGILRGFFVPSRETSDANEQSASQSGFNRQSFITLAIFAAGTYLILGSLFLLSTGGLSAGLAAIPAYFRGWLDFTDVPGWRLLAGLAFYELFALLLAFVGLVRGILKGNELVISLGIWLASSLVLTLLYPSRQVADLTWALIPLLALASLEICTYFVPTVEGIWETVGMAAFTGAILAFAYINYSTIALVQTDQSQLRWWVLIGSLALLVVSIAMVAFGWSVSTAVQGSLWGALFVLFIYNFSTAMASSGLRVYQTTEMWPSSAYIGQAKTLLSQLDDLSRWKAGIKDSLDVNIVGLDSPALQWILRDWPVTVSSGLSIAGSTPTIVIAPDQFSSPDMETTYRGQGLTWREFPSWDQGLKEDWMRWSIMHEFPQIDEKIILWVRNDVFIDSQNNQ